MMQLPFSSNVRFWFAKAITLQQRNSRALGEGNNRPSWCEGMLRQQKRTRLPILNIDFALENKTQEQQTKYSVTGVFRF